MAPTVLLWLRRDLRLADNPALAAAAASGRPVVPVFILEEHDREAAWTLGGASRWWLHHALAALEVDLAPRGLSVVLRRGRAAEVLPDLAREAGADRVFWNRRWEPAEAAVDRAVAAALGAAGVGVEDFPASLLWEPEVVMNRQGGPYKVFTPYWKRLLDEAPPARPLPVPGRIAAPAALPASLSLDALELLPRIRWDAGLAAAWRPGEAGALAAWQAFGPAGVAGYADERDRPDHVGTSRLAPHLHFGEISPRTLWHGLESLPGGDHVRRQLVWREFAHHLLHHFPHTVEEPLDERFERVAWDGPDEHLEAWRRGRTGYPLVDAGMRELWATGWMHNRVRMVVASFLVKHLLLPWQEGAAWFRDTLVDADLANNTLGWQWTAGCGADAAPFFRIFNPVAQGKKFDPRGDYVRRWVPELAGLPAKVIHAPWEAAPLDLAGAGVVLGRTYPRPLVDHARARARALAAWDTIRGA